MSDEKFDISDAIMVFERLTADIRRSLTSEDKKMLSEFVRLESDFSQPETSPLKHLPGIQWKIRNLQNLRAINRQKFETQCRLLEEVLTF